MIVLQSGVVSTSILQPNLGLRESTKIATDNKYRTALLPSRQFNNDITSQSSANRVALPVGKNDENLVVRDN